MKLLKVSREEAQRVVDNRILDVDVLLDIGVGIRPQTVIRPAIYLGIEPYLPYIEHLRKEVSDDPRFVFLNCTWEEGLKALAPKSVDSVFAFDIIEHLEKEEGFQLIREAERVARRQVVIFTPWGFFPQSYNDPDELDRWGMQGTYWQTHRSGWLPEDFGDGWTIIGCENFHLVDHDEKPLEKPFGALWAFRNFEDPAQGRFNRRYPVQAQDGQRAHLSWSKQLLRRVLPGPAYTGLSQVWHSLKKG